MAGIITGLAGRSTVIGFSVLKKGNFLEQEVRRLATQSAGRDFSNWRIETDYHFGGYAKKTRELDIFMLRMAEEQNLPLDFVYSGKLVAGVFDLISKNHFPIGSRILMLHTGGLRN
jgi:1-aminocyclopropane-1-carboxylate deaminase/D-cysteine desulfhydrase-like pyridoxal-dependent ACC family enzyme